VAAQLRPSRWLVGLGAAAIAIVGSYGFLWGLSRAFGANFHLARPPLDRVVMLVLAGQAVRALAEEVYYRGLLQSEMSRLAPRLGARGATARRWAALLPPSLLFAMEHIPVGAPHGEILRQFAFPLSLGLLLGILVMLTKNLVFAAGVHAWINWLLLGAAPVLAEPSGAPAIPAGTYIGLALALTFLVAFYLQPRRSA
jgi:membrane protease YdiL (CAAX protease family)